MRPETRPAAGLLLLLLVLFALALGCRQDVPPLFRRNQPPETTLTIVPEEDGLGLYRYHVYWRGEDSDGSVVRYIFAITDTLSRDEEQNWDPQLFEDRDRSVYTDKTDSIFVFNARSGRQALNISAIDDFGRPDPSPARAFFHVRANGEPKVQLLAIQGFRDGTVLPPCGLGVQCTIPTYTNFKVRFTGTTPNGRITGYQWQGIRASEPSPEPPQPTGIDSVFYAADDDSTAFVFGSTTDTLWSLRQNIVTVFYYSIREDTTRRIAAGNFSFRARVRDEARRESGFRDDGGTTRIVVNFDPETRLYRIPGRDCPRCAEPNPPPYCTSGDSVPVGFIAGFDQTALPDTSQWIRFCAGDTLPQLAHARFYVTGRDDRRDIPIDPAGLRNVRFTAAFTYVARGELPQDDLTSLQKIFKPDPRSVLGSYHLPDGTPWRGWVNGWGDPLIFPGVCPFDFNYYAAAVDENKKADGTPDSIPFYVSGSSTIDTPPAPPLVVVLAPQCPPAFAAFCPLLAGVSFGPDTLFLVGRHVPDTAQPPVTPLGLGKNLFALECPVTGHDHPQDTRPEIRQTFWGRILSWKFGFSCTGCEDLELPGEGQWREDIYAQNAFDDTLRVSLFLDTLCTRLSTPSNPCGFDFKVALPMAPLGTYRFTLKGKDTSAVSGSCLQPSDLGPTPASFSTSTSPYGRFTGEFARTLVLRQLQEVRPYVHGPKVAVRSSPPRKGWWRR